MTRHAYLPTLILSDKGSQFRSEFKSCLEYEFCGCGEGPPAEPRREVFPWNFSSFAVQGHGNLGLKFLLKSFFFFWMSQQNKAENFVKNFAANFAKNFARTAPLQNGNFAQNFALQKPFQEALNVHLANVHFDF